MNKNKYGEIFNKDEFALLLRGLIENNNILIFSEAIGIPQRTIYSWINKTRIPTIENLIILAKHFDCSIDYLIGLKDY